MNFLKQPWQNNNTTAKQTSSGKRNQPTEEITAYKKPTVGNDINRAKALKSKLKSTPVKE